MAEVKMFHPSNPDNVVVAGKAAFDQVYSKRGWKLAKEKAEVTPERVAARDEDEFEERQKEAKADAKAEAKADKP